MFTSLVNFVISIYNYLHGLSSYLEYTRWAPVIYGIFAYITSSRIFQFLSNRRWKKRVRARALTLRKIGDIIIANQVARVHISGHGNFGTVAEFKVEITMEGGSKEFFLLRISIKRRDPPLEGDYKLIPRADGMVFCLLNDATGEEEMNFFLSYRS